VSAPPGGIEKTRATGTQKNNNSHVLRLRRIAAEVAHLVSQHPGSRTLTALHAAVLDKLCRAEQAEKVGQAVSR
jgi:hypothetical protein